MTEVGRRRLGHILLSIAVQTLLQACSRARTLPFLTTVPPFELTDQWGARFGSTQLDGKVWVANFVFTRCGSVCPTLSARMARVQAATERLGDSVRLVSFSVDPEFDTPERLAEYAARFGAGPRWMFLTGTRRSLEQVVTRGLKQVMSAGDGTLASIAHGSSALLIDPEGTIRGSYRLDDTGVERIAADAAELAGDTAQFP